MRNRVIIIVIIFIFSILLGLLSESLSRKQQVMEGGSTSDQMLLNMLGETRYTLAAFAWLKADYYHHEYELNGEDWRRNQALMSLIRLVTYLDPHFIQAYDFGGYHLAVNLKKTDEGLAFLQEGIRNNPDSFELLWETGYILTVEKKYQEAIPYLLRALPLYEQRSSMDNTALKKIWVISRLCHSYYEIGDRKNACKYAVEWLKLDPGTNWPKEVLKTMGGQEHE